MDMTAAQDELKTLRRRLFELRLQKERGEVKNNRQFPQTRADIARLMHHINELNHEAELAAAGVLIAEDETESPAPVEKRETRRITRRSAPAATDEVEA